MTGGFLLLCASLVGAVATILKKAGQARLFNIM
jgi:hypothetical protein